MPKNHHEGEHILKVGLAICFSFQALTVEWGA
jgi:hypothetical protein